MVGNIHNTRILRFLLVIGAVILTIFIYASYSTSPQLGPAHMHTHLSLAPEALQQQISINNKSGELSISGIIIGNGVTVDSNADNLKLNYDKHQSNVHLGSKRKIYYSNNIIDANPLKKQHRQPTVDIDAGGSDIPSNNPIDDGPADEAALDRLVSNYFLEEQYLSNVDNAMGNINNSASVTTGGEGGGTGPNNGKISEIKQNTDPHRRQSQNQYALDNAKNGNNNNNNKNNNNNSKSPTKVLESDVLIPTSNLQKFIENADKILKNMTSATSNSMIASQQQQQQQQQKPEEIKPENVKPPEQENQGGDPKKVKEVGKGNMEDAIVDDDYDESQQNSVIMTIKSASKVGMPEEEGGGVGGDGVKQQQETEKVKAIEMVKSVMKLVESKDEKKPNEMQKKQVTQTSVSAPAAALKIAIEQSQSQSNGGGGAGAGGAGASSSVQNLASKPEMKPIKDKSTADPIQSNPAQAALQIPSKPVASVVSKNATNQAANKPVDTSQGIPTIQLYESGHLDDELDIERICPHQGADLKLLILITSAQSHQEARLAVRQTWGHYGSRRDVSTAFVLGRSANQTLNLALTQENFIYGDLIRGNFIDSYNNLTLKTISSLEWVDKHCSRAKFILKTDDDMFINVPKLLQFLDGHSKDKRTIFGRLAKKWKPVRNKKSKYYVSTTQFSATVFPSFTTGPAYVLTSDIIHDLYDRSLQQVYFKLEDVFTTGIVAQQLNIKRIHVNEFLNRRIAFNPCNIRKTISVHMIKANEQFDLWKKLLDQTTKCK